MARTASVPTTVPMTLTATLVPISVAGALDAPFLPAVKMRSAPGTTTASMTDARFEFASVKAGTGLAVSTDQRHTFRPVRDIRARAHAVTSVPSLENAALTTVPEAPRNLRRTSPVLTLQMRT